MEVREENIAEALSENRFMQLFSKINALPDSEEFKKRVEEDLWKAFVPSEYNNDNEINYRNLPKNSREIFGYTLTDEGEEEAPWWFKSFKWKARCLGEEITLEKTENRDTITTIQNFDLESTLIEKPTLRENSVIGGLDSLKSIGKELDNNFNWEIENRHAELELPENIFRIRERKIVTSEEFKEWFNSLLELCPPLNTQLTSIFMLDTNVRKKYAEKILPEGLMQKIRNLGLISERRGTERVHNENYADSLKELLTLKGVFDLIIPGGGSYEDLDPLEFALYETWAKKNQDIRKKTKKWLERALDRSPDKLKTGEEGEFSEVAFMSPLSLHRKRAVLAPFGVTTKGRYYFRARKKRMDIKSLFEEHDILG